MKNFTIKFTLLFMTLISLMFFTLVFFQKINMEKQMQYQHFEPYHQPFMQAPPIPPKTNEPPLIIPFLFISIISFTFTATLLKYIEKNFINPLNTIQNNLKEIKNGNLETIFSTKSESSSVMETYSTLNQMIAGLKHKEKLQDEFIQKLSHDLRAPLVAQERAIEILKEEFNNHELLDGLLKNSQEYTKMINIILQSFNQQEVNIDKTSFNLYEICQKIISTFKSSALKKNISIINKTDKNLTVWADYISLLRILSNLISNSIENIDYDKQITINAFKNPTETRIIIEDNGKGISEDKINNIFNKYYSDSSEKIVSGLGLYIVKELVEKNNGNIKLESKLNSFTRFTITLPNGEINE